MQIESPLVIHVFEPSHADYKRLWIKKSPPVAWAGQIKMGIRQQAAEGDKVEIRYGGGISISFKGFQFHWRLWMHLYCVNCLFLVAHSENALVNDFLTAKLHQRPIFECMRGVPIQHSASSKRLRRWCRCPCHELEFCFRARFESFSIEYLSTYHEILKM